MHSSLLLFLGWVLLLSPSFLSPTNHVHAALAIQPTINSFANLLYGPLILQASLSYQIDTPTFPGISLTQGGTAASVISAAASGTYDFVVSNSAIPPANQAQLSTQLNFPLFVNSVAPFYALPSTTGAARLILSMIAMCQIMRGNISQWNDPRLVALNPTLMLPTALITLIVFNFGSDAILTVSRLCNKVDAGWASLPGLGVTNFPAYITYVKPTQLIWVTAAQSTAGMASLVLDNLYSFAIIAQTTVLTVQVRNAYLINSAGKLVLPTPGALATTFSELAANGIVPGGNNLDLTNPSSGGGWPLCFAAWLWIDSKGKGGGGKIIRASFASDAMGRVPHIEQMSCGCGCGCCSCAKVIVSLQEL
jgi:ABC-type phosphate transport system substrate-binding protein